MENILVIDDEISITKLLERVLVQEGYKVTCLSATSTVESILSSISYDLVISDLKMPDCNGIDLLKRIKKLFPKMEVIIMTGQATLETAVEAIKSGAYDYILKPFNIDEVMMTVKKCLDHSRLARQENIYRETTNLYQLAQEITKNNTEKELLNFILDRATKTLNADTGSIFMIVPGKDQLSRSSVHSLLESPMDDIAFGEKVIGWVAENKEAVLIQDSFSNVPHFRNMPVREDILSSLICPLINQDVLLGVICLNRLKSMTNYQFSVHDLESLRLFGMHATLLIAAIQYKESQKQLDEMRSEFMSNVSHELRTPLMAIGGAIDLLYPYMEAASDNAKVKMFFDLIKRNSTRMQLLVNDLLDFSRMETDKIKLLPVKFNLKTLVDETIQDLHLRAKEKNIELTSYCYNPEVELFADHERVKQIIVNLLGNAIKFTEEKGSVKLEVLLEESRNSVLITVSDTGIGIPSDKLDRVFEKFYQVDGSATRMHSGFGLGLSIVKSIVTKHNGKIWVESSEGRGTKFLVRLPIYLKEA